MKLFWCPRTRAARAVWLLEESGLDYERVLVDVRDPASRDIDGFNEASPMGKVPALQDGDVALAESAAIALYVADKYPQTRLAPSIDHPDRGRYLYWSLYTPAVIEPAMIEKIGGHKPNRGQHGWGDFDTMIHVFEQGLAKGPWILGEQFSAADTLVGSSAVFMRQFQILPDSRILNEYADRCLERAAYQRALELDAGHALG